MAMVLACGIVLAAVTLDNLNLVSTAAAVVWSMNALIWGLLGFFTRR